MARKGENIYKRKDGRWEGRYIKSRSERGKIIYGYVYAKTYRDVKNKLRDINATLKQPLIEIKNDKILFSNVADEWFENIKVHTKESTQNKYHNILIYYILPTYGSKTLDKINYDFIEAHRNQLLLSGGINQQGLSGKTVSEVLSIIRSILKFAIRKGMNVPCDGSSVQVKCPIKAMRVLSKNEQNQLCKYILDNLNPYNIGILICLFTGLRVGEICALKWDDVSLDNQIIQVRHTLQRIQNNNQLDTKTKVIITTPKSSCSIRVIPIPDELCRILNDYKQSETGFLLTNDDQRYIEPRIMQYKFKKVLKASDIEEVNFHVLRHTFATRCVELGFDVKTLSEILGHSSVNTTLNRYVHPTLELKKANMKKLSSLITTM